MEKLSKCELIKRAKFCGKIAQEADCQYQIVRQFFELYSKYKQEMNISLGFYTTVIYALFYSSIMELAKLYDNHKDSVYISAIQNQIQMNLEWFGKDTFQPLVDRKRKLKKIIENLRSIRNKAYAHSDKELLNDMDKVFNEYPISFEDVEKLIEFAFDICNYVLEPLAGNSFKREALDAYDLQRIFIYTRLGLKYEENARMQNPEAFRQELAEMRKA